MKKNEKKTKKTIEQGERIFFFNGEQTKEDFKNNLYIFFFKKINLHYPPNNF